MVPKNAGPSLLDDQPLAEETNVRTTNILNVRRGKTMNQKELNNTTMDQQNKISTSYENELSRLMPIQNRMAFVCDNALFLKKKGLYEEALLFAYIGAKIGFGSWSPSAIELLFSLADRKKLAEAGDPIPDQKDFTLYRGVGGIGRQRRVSGVSWTSSFEQALWFAERAKNFGFADPAVFKITVQRESILAYCNNRKEEEYLLQLPLSVKPKRIERV